jgi:transmembrane sensor
MNTAEEIEATAADWLIESIAGLPAEQQVSFSAWLAADVRHRAAFLRLRYAWTAMNPLATLGPSEAAPDVGTNGVQDFNAAITLNRRRLRDYPRSEGTWLRNCELQHLTTATAADAPQSPWRFRLPTRAALSFFVFSLAMAVWIAASQANWDSYATSVGGYEHVVLADGSSVQLNTDSEFVARIAANRRDIRVLRGEALINVAFDSKRPLYLQMNDTAIGEVHSQQARSSFAVRVTEAKSVHVSVIEGRVSVGPARSWYDGAFKISAASFSTLSPGDYAVIDSNRIYVTNLGIERLNRKLAWQAGLLSFKGETLDQVVSEFNRYNRRQLVVADPILATRQIGGAFQATDPDSFVVALEHSFGIRALPESVDNGAGIIRLKASRAANP